MRVRARMANCNCALEASLATLAGLATALAALFVWRCFVDRAPAAALRRGGRSVDILLEAKKARRGGGACTTPGRQMFLTAPFCCP